MSYATILTAYSNQIGEYKGVGPFVATFPAHTTGSTEGGTATVEADDEEEAKPIPNPSYTLLSSLQTVLTNTQSAIYNAAHYLYEDPSMRDGNGALIRNDNNFSIINGYADGSKTFELYKSDDEVFLEQPDFFWTRGKFYGMLPAIYEGEYLRSYGGINVAAKIQNIVAICSEYNDKFVVFEEEWTPPSSDAGGEDDESGISVEEAFWSKPLSDDKDAHTNSSKFRERILAEFTDFANESLQMNSTTYVWQFNNFRGIVEAYITLFEEATEDLSKIDVFVSSLNKTVDGPDTRLSDTYANIGVDGFAAFSTKLDKIFQIFLDSIAERDRSHFAAEDTYNTILTKIFQSKVLEEADFFTTATSLKDRTAGFARRYSLL